MGSTQCNDVSSRSHAILTLHVESRVSHATTTTTAAASTYPLSPAAAFNHNTSAFMDDPYDYKHHLQSTNNGAMNTPTSNTNATSPELRLGKMHLVDLAGSERVGTFIIRESIIDICCLL